MATVGNPQVSDGASSAELLAHIQSNNVGGVRSAMARGATPMMHKVLEMGNPEMIRVMLDHRQVLDPKRDLPHALNCPDPVQGLDALLRFLTPQQIACYSPIEFIQSHGQSPSWGQKKEPETFGLVESQLLSLVASRHPDPDVFLNQLDSADLSPLQHAIVFIKNKEALHGEAHRVLVETMLKLGARCTPEVLTQAAESLEDLSVFLQHRPPTDVMNARGQLPLHNAAQKGLLLNVQQLLEAGADLHAKSITGLTPLLSAAGHPEVVEWLLSVGANLLDVNNHGENLLMRAASKGEVFQDVLDIVLKQNPSAIDRLLSQESKDGDSMMHIMSKNGAMGSPHLSFFLSSPLGLSLINSRNTRGETPLMVACSAQSAVSLRPLIDAGADLNAQDNKGFTALMHAMEADAKGAFEELLMRGANPMLPNRYGKNLLDMAIDQNKPDFLPHLLSLGVPLSTDLRFMREDKKKRMPHFAGESPVVSAIRTSSPAFLQFHLKQTDPDDVDLLAGQRHVKRSKDRAEMSAVLNSHIAQKSMDSVVHKTGLLP